MADGRRHAADRAEIDVEAVVARGNASDMRSIAFGRGRGPVRSIC